MIPAGTTTFTLSNPPFTKASGLRKGGSYRVQSNIPVVAYQHSPIGAQATNDASMLLPEHALKQDYIVASYQDGLNGVDLPSYFNVMAAVDNTTVKWTPPQATLAGPGVPAVAANATGQVVMNRHDTMEVRTADNGDISGTFVTADKPIWVVGAVNCANVPPASPSATTSRSRCSRSTIGARSTSAPTRPSAAARSTTGASTAARTAPSSPPPGPARHPDQPQQGPVEELVIANNTSFIFESDKPFLPVQYLAGQDGGAGTGDPASTR
jgi:hypothetical protein